MCERVREPACCPLALHSSQKAHITVMVHMDGRTQFHAVTRQPGAKKAPKAGGSLSLFVEPHVSTSWKWVTLGRYCITHRVKPEPLVHIR